jgi:hypothetical protein
LAFVRAVLLLEAEDAPVAMKAGFNPQADHRSRLLLRKCASVNAPLTNALKGVTTSFPNPAATTSRYLHGKRGTREAVMFSVIRIIVLMACAYAGSVVAEMQIAISPDTSAVSQP